MGREAERERKREIGRERGQIRERLRVGEEEENRAREGEYKH